MRQAEGWTRRGWLGGLGAAAATLASPARALAAVTELEALRDELARGLAELALPGKPRPWYIELRLIRLRALTIHASYGAVVSDLLERQAGAVVRMRVGSPERDSGQFGIGGGTARFELPLTPAATPARRRLWLALDRAYRSAVATYDAKQVALRNFPSRPPPEGLWPGPGPLVELGWAEPGALLDAPDAPLPIDRDGLRDVVRKASAAMRRHPGVDNGDVLAMAVVAHETTLTTEGLAIGARRERMVLGATADTRALDHMHVDHGDAIHLDRLPADLGPLSIQLDELTERVLVELEQLAAAPMLEEDYDGPLLLAPRASAEVLATTLAPQATGVPAPLFDFGRLDDLEPGLLDRIGQMIMPDWIDVIDDPSGPGFGAIARDAEGIEARPITLIERGIFKEPLTTRQPNAERAASNGRARATLFGEVGPAITRLRLEPRVPGKPRAALEAELLARAAEDGYRYGYRIDALRDGTVLGPVGREGASTYDSGRKFALPIPQRLFKCDANGQQTLVRGAVLAPVSLRVLRRIRAHGDVAESRSLRIAPGVTGGFGADLGLGGMLAQTVDATVTSPALLVTGFELTVERGEHERPPLLQHPLRRKRSS